MLLRSPAVEKELKITEAQKKELAEITRERTAKIQQARKDIKDRAKFQAARAAILAGSTAATTEKLKPEQRERLVQIQLQAQGPLAFTVREPVASSDGPGSPDFVGPRLSEYLKMSDDQVKRVRAIVDEGTREIEKAASFDLKRDFPEKPTTEATRKLVGGSEFRTAKDGARRAGLAARNAVIKRIEAVLNADQVAGYRKILGTPFDLAKLNPDPGESESVRDVRLVTGALGLNGQRADPDFNVTVARPAFTTVRPRLAIDEAHKNFHTALGRYKPFADLMTNDGFLVVRNTRPFDAQTLVNDNILVIANASAASAPGDSDSSKSAFTEAECAAIQAWVWSGGSLLLITDHEPFGSASRTLAQRFGVLMNAAGTTDPASQDEKSRGLLFTRERFLILDHPITIGRDPTERINRVATFFGQALIGPVGSTPFLRFADTATFESTTGPQSAAGWAQGVALSYGAGRVVVMGEAAALSAQLGGQEPMGMNVPGIDNRQMALNIMHWLSWQLEPPTVASPGTIIYYAPPVPVQPVLYPVLSGPR
jgi:hypothetical protein